MARAGWSLAPDDDAAEMYLWSMERLEGAGYAQYEISNVARPGFASRHNLKYWQDGEWVGFGCGAHSTAGGARWKNVASTEDYVRRIGLGQPVAIERRELGSAVRMEEALFTGLRLNEGLDLERIGARYDIDVWAKYGERCSRSSMPDWSCTVPVSSGSRVRACFWQTRSWRRSSRPETAGTRRAGC